MRDSVQGAENTLLPKGTLRFLVYSSLAVTRFYEEDLELLLSDARSRNSAVGITGLLLYRNDRFIQFLEGEPAAIDELMLKIQRDRRHTNIRVGVDEWSLTRQFHDWTMGYRAMRSDGVPAPDGFRDSFADIAEVPTAVTSGRAAKELALWFRVRSGLPALAVA
ncbi:BLUF domain-containing protein [Leucobacter sp. VD1]|uniref:BLUF domain-containing protein n=1 Tax=Leucobacter sp. VD1 TaxID=3080381 RepID=UPI00301603AB